MLIELLAAMMFLSTAIGALVSVYVSTAHSLQNSGIQGTATTLVDRQIELYNTLSYAAISLDSSTIPTGSDPYVTAHSSDTTIPSSTGLVTGATVVSGTCAAPT